MAGVASALPLATASSLDAPGVGTSIQAQLGIAVVGCGWTLLFPQLSRCLGLTPSIGASATGTGSRDDARVVVRREHERRCGFGQPMQADEKLVDYIRIYPPVSTSPGMDDDRASRLREAYSTILRYANEDWNKSVMRSKAPLGQRRGEPMDDSSLPPITDKFDSLAARMFSGPRDWNPADFKCARRERRAPCPS